MKAKQLRAVIYIRQSITHDDSVSPTLQRDACERYARDRNYEVVDVIDDLGISGRTFKRPGVQRAVEMIEAGKTDVILVWKWSRLSRRRYDWAMVTDKVESLGGRIESATEPVDVSTAAGRFQRGILTEFSAFESDRIGEVWEEVHADLRAKGRPHTGGDRYGYRRRNIAAPEERKRFVYEIDPDEAATLQWAYREYLGGRGLSGVTAELNRRGIPGPRGRAWSHQTLANILDSGFAVGLIYSGGTIHGDRHWFPGEHPTIIDKATWDTYVAARHARTTVPPRAVEPRYPLTGLVFCECGASMWARQGGTRQPGGSYQCGHWLQTGGDGVCVTISRPRAEQAVLDWLRPLTADVGAAAQATRRVQRSVERTKETAKAASRRIAKLDDEMAQLALSRVRLGISSEAYDKAAAALRAERADLQVQVDAALVANAPARTARPPADLAKKLVEQWDVLPAARRRDLLAALISKVIISRPARRHGASQVRIVPVWA